jgi:hypothetical protein
MPASQDTTPDLATMVGALASVIDLEDDAACVQRLIECRYRLIDIAVILDRARAGARRRRATGADFFWRLHVEPPEPRTRKLKALR